MAVSGKKRPKMEKNNSSLFSTNNKMRNSAIRKSLGKLTAPPPGATRNP
jgi:hypothetical protein